MIKVEPGQLFQAKYVSIAFGTARSALKSVINDNEWYFTDYKGSRRIRKNEIIMILGVEHETTSKKTLYKICYNDKEIGFAYIWNYDLRDDFDKL